MTIPLHSNVQATNSPSKSSLRRTSGVDRTHSERPNKSPSPGPTTHFASLATQHHFLPHSPPNANLDYDEDEEEEETIAYNDSASYQTAPQPQTPFQPFFALVEDTTTNEHYHPTVHYIFADDEPDVITEAACRSLGQDSDESNPNSRTDKDQAANHDDPEPRLPPPRPGVKEHYLILDVHPSQNANPPSQQQFSDRLPSPSPSSVETAHALPKAYPYTVTSAQSLSADWQVLRTSITNAPTMHAEHDHTDEHHLMLRIEGRGNSPDTALQRKEGETIEDMIERFQTRLAEIRHLMVDVEAEDGPPDIAGVGVGAEVERPTEDMFTQAGLVGIGFTPTGFGNAVLDEQD